MARLKVFRTSIGFHDAYIAAPSRKAALQAWGAEKDLFAMGAAEVVTDAALTAAPLAAPGEVIRLTRGDLRDHLDAADKQRPPEARARNKPVEAKPGQRKAAPPPRPSRGELDKAEQELAAARAEAQAEARDMARREAELAKERRDMEARHRRAAAKLEAARDEARSRYDRAMADWRAR